MTPLEGNGFSTKEVRSRFVRKVYTILSVQLAITTAFIILFNSSESAVDWVEENDGTVSLSFLLYIFTYFAIVCCPGLRRTYPANLILLGVFTLAMSFMTAVFTTFYNTKAIWLAAGISSVSCIAVTLFSFKSDWDLTEYSGIMLVLLTGLCFSGFVLLFVSTPLAQKVQAACGALMFTAYLAVDTQKIMGGKKIEIDPEEHIYAALILYMDLIILFKDLISVLGHRER